MLASRSSNCRRILNHTSLLLFPAPDATVRRLSREGSPQYLPHTSSRFEEVIESNRPFLVLTCPVKGIAREVKTVVHP